MFERFFNRNSASLNFENKLIDLILYDAETNNCHYIKYFTNYKILNSLIFDYYADSKLLNDIKKQYKRNDKYRALIIAGRGLTPVEIKRACSDFCIKYSHMISMAEEMSEESSSREQKEELCSYTQEQEKSIHEQEEIRLHNEKVEYVSRELAKLNEELDKLTILAMERLQEREKKECSIDKTDIDTKELQALPNILSDNNQNIDVIEDVEAQVIDEMVDEVKKFEYINSDNNNSKGEVVSPTVIENLVDDIHGQAEVPVNNDIIDNKCDIIRQYKYKFYLNANHAIYIGDNMGQVHPHSWEIIIDVLNVNTDFIQFNNIEKVIDDIFNAYQKKVLNDIPPFDKLNPTLENICLFFLKVIQRKLNAFGFKVLLIEISETPSRSFMINVSDTVDKNVIMEEDIIVENYVDSFLENLS